MRELEKSHQAKIQELELASRQEKKELERNYQKINQLKEQLAQERFMHLREEPIMRLREEVIERSRKQQLEDKEREKGQAQSFTEDLGNGIKLEMIAIPGGTFMRGSPEGEGKDNEHEKPQHKVTVQPFFMGKYPITQAQYQQVMSNNPSRFKGDERSVECVSWDDAVEFCQRLSKKTGTEYRLPSEAEWEYACRAGTNTPYYFGDTLTEKLANYGRKVKETIAVGQFPPNAFGLYDMHGNVLEWCQDNWHGSYEDAPKDGSAWSSGQSRTKVVRGGSWASNPNYCRSAVREEDDPHHSYSLLGCRVACGGART